MSVEKRFCSECGKECTLNDKFCSACGNALPQDNSLTKTECMPNTEPHTYKKANKPVGLILIFLGVSAIIIDFLIYIGILAGIAGSGFISGILLISLGIVLFLKRIKKFGWGIAAILTASGVINNFLDYYKYSHLSSLIASAICLLLTVVFVCLVLKANSSK